VESNSCFAQPGDAGNVASTAPAVAAVSFSPAIRDILKMLDAKVDIEVIKAYVRNSNIAYNPNASEIIGLKQHGVPDEVITALLQRGAEVRAQLAQSRQATAPAMPPNNPAPAYPYDYGASLPDYNTYPAYPAYADYGYPYYGYAYGGYPYDYSYPWAFYSPFYFGFYGHRDFDRFHRFGDFDRFHRFDGFRGDRFHGDRSFAFRGGAGFGNRSPWTPVNGSFAHRSFAGGGFSGRSFGNGGGRPGGFTGHMGGFAGRAGGFGGHGGGGGGHGGGHR